MNWTPICTLDDIIPDTGVGALIEHHQLAVFRLEDDRVFAIDNFDPRSQANVLSRGIVGDIDGEPVVASPIYKQHLRLKDGRCLEDETYSVTPHSVRINNGQIEVALSRPFVRAA